MVAHQILMCRYQMQDNERKSKPIPSDNVCTSIKKKNAITEESKKKKFEPFPGNRHKCPGDGPVFTFQIIYLTVNG